MSTEQALVEELARVTEERDEFEAAMIRATHRVRKMQEALERIRDCDWVITLPDRMDAVRKIAREALK